MSVLERCPSYGMSVLRGFTVYLNDLFYVVEYTDICNFADDTTFNSTSTDVDEAMTSIEHGCTFLVEWFRDDYMTLDASKCHLLVSGYKDELMFAKVGGELL